MIKNIHLHWRINGLNGLYNPVAINREDEKPIVFWYDMLVDVFWF